MIRLLLAWLCAVGLALSPAPAIAAAAAATPMAGCDMKGEMPEAPADHAKKDCCVPACQAAASAAFLPQNGSDSAGLSPEPRRYIGVAAKELASFKSSGLDPPPRA